MFVMLIVLSLVIFAGYLLWQYFTRDEKWLSNANQQAHLPLSAKALATASEEAFLAGLGAEFAAYQQGLQKRLAPAPLQVGHLLWIFDQLEQNCRYHDQLAIPQFHAPSAKT